MSKDKLVALSARARERNLHPNLYCFLALVFKWPRMALDIHGTTGMMRSEQSNKLVQCATVEIIEGEDSDARTELRLSV